MAKLEYIPINASGGIDCPNNCTVIIGVDEPLPPIPEPLPPEGFEWVYDIWGEHVLDVNGDWVYTEIFN